MPKVRRILAKKLISDCRMADLECKHLDESYIRHTITENTVATDENGHCVFVFLKAVIPPAPQKRALHAAMKMRLQSTKNSNRCALKGNGGWELNFGWSDTQQRFPEEIRNWIKKHHRQDLYTPVRLFAPTLQQYSNWIKFDNLIPHHGKDRCARKT